MKSQKTSITTNISISVVIPAHNVEDFIRRSVNSVLAQKYTPLEIIVVDDGSTDGTATVVQSYGDAVRYLHQKNSGVAVARNTGIHAATGNYIAFLDADDEWRPHHLENAAKILQTHPDLRWYGAAVNQYIHETGQVVAEYKEKKPGRLIEGAYFKDYMTAFPPYAHIAPSTMVIHRPVFNEVGMFDPAKRMGQDLDMWFRIALYFPQIGYSHTVAANIYKRKTSISYTKKVNFERDFGLLQEKERIAHQFGADAVHRAEPRLMFWCTRLLKASIGRGDQAAVREILANYQNRLPLRWRWLSFIFLALPGSFRLVFFMRNLLSGKQRAFVKAKLR